jgi:hypothetical protein
VAAKPFDKPVGEEVNLIGGGPTTLDAGEAFHFAHGFGLDPAESHPIGGFEFRLDVGGVDQGKGMLLTSGVGYDDDLFGKGEMVRKWLYNFDGFDSGTYTFTGHWLAPCQAAVDTLGYLGPCPKKNAQVDVLTLSLNVAFN